MQNILKYQHFYFLVFIGLIFLTLSCKEKSNTEKIIKRTAVNSFTEGTFYIDSVYVKNGKYYATVDKIEYKKRADKNDNTKQNKIDLPNGYYITNDKVEPTQKSISDSVTITMQTINYDEYGNFKFNEKISLIDFINAFNKPENKRYKHIPFKIAFSNNTIISITEIYIP